MSEITLEAIAKTMEAVIKQEIYPVKTILTNIETTQNTHTAALDQILKNMKTREDEAIIAAKRFDRLEEWARRVSKQLGIKLEL